MPSLVSVPAARRGACATRCGLLLGASLVAACGPALATRPTTPAIGPAVAETEPLEPSVEPPPAPPAEPQPPGPEDVRVEELEHDGLRYLDIVLGRSPADAALPLVVVLHGRGDRAQVPSGPFWPLPRAVRVIAPEGPLPLGDQFMWSVWRVADGRDDALAADLAVMADRIASLIVHVTATRPTLGRAIVTGFSQGGHLTFAIALRHPELVSTALPSAGWIPPSLVPELADAARFPRLRSVHGADDERVPAGPTRALVERLRAAGLDAELVVFEGEGHAMSAAMDATFRAWLLEALERTANEGTADEGTANDGATGGGAADDAAPNDTAPNDTAPNDAAQRGPL